MALVTMSICIGDSDAEADPISSNASVVASGTCGDDTTWSYMRTAPDNGVLTITGSKVGSLDSWHLASLTINDSPASGFTKITEVLNDEDISIVFESQLSAVSKGAMSGLGVCKATFVTSTVILSSMFDGCRNLSEVDVGPVMVIGDYAFKGCTSLREMSIKGATEVSLKAFEGCTGLASLEASEENEVYASYNGMLYTDDWQTLYMCPPGVSKVLGNSDIMHDGTWVSMINLGYEKVLYAIDAKGCSNNAAFVDATSSTVSKGLVYSSLGMSDHSVDMTISLNKVVQAMISYTLYQGWGVTEECLRISGGTATIGTGEITVTFGDDLFSEMYPMGERTLTSADLQGMQRAGDWMVRASVASSGFTESTVQEITNAPEIYVVGYAGESSSAVLGGTLYFNGIICKVGGISLTSDTAGDLEDLVIEDDVPIEKDAFAAISTIRSVKADNVGEVGDGAFKYCTGLQTASFASCSKFGANAFIGCVNLSKMTLGYISSIDFGSNAIRGCESLDVLEVGLDTAVTGATDVFLVHHANDDMFTGFTIYHSVILIECSFAKEVYYSGTNDRDSATVVSCYYGSGHSYTTIDKVDEIYLWATPGSLKASCLVVFDYGLDMGHESQTVKFGRTVSAPDNKFVLGYKFSHWDLNGERYNFNEAVSTSIVLTAVWEKDEPFNTIAAYIGVMLVIAIVVSAIMFRMTRRMLRG